jgi:hypothetical protein
MMPQLLTVRVEHPGRRTLRFWVPVLPLVLLLSPILLLAVLAAFVACAIFSIDAVRALGTVWRMVAALPGTRVDIQEGRTAVLVTVR